MAKKCYIGVDGIAKKVKKGYVGVLETPIYETKSVTVDIKSEAALKNVFDVTHDKYYFACNSSGNFERTNENIPSSEARSEWVAKYDISSITLHYYVFCEATFDKLIVTVAGNTIVRESGEGKSGVWTGSLKKGESIVLVYSKDHGTDYGSDTGRVTITELTYTEVTQIGGFNTEPVAHLIKKAYIGIGGVARPCWSGGELAYWGTATALTNARRYLAATSVGDYAIFCGGEEKSGVSYGIDAYDKSLTHSEPTKPYHGRWHLAATTVGNYALFGGGSGSSGGGYTTVDAYDTSLTRTNPEFLSLGRGELAATSVGDYALFGGGEYYDSDYDITVSVDDVDVYDSSLTKQTAKFLCRRVSGLAATSVGDYALFGGGNTNEGGAYGLVSAFNTSLTRTQPSNFTDARDEYAATTVGDYALFGGGTLIGSPLSYVDAYNSSLTKMEVSALSVGMYQLAATTVGDYALFGGGYQTGATMGGTVVNMYDASLTRTVTFPLSTGRAGLAATTVGDFALFGGGHHNSTGRSTIVDVYTVA